jgi:hypothetical protein
MMIPPLPPTPSVEARDTVAALLAIIKNPDEAQKHLTLIKEAAEALRKYHEGVKVDQDRLANSKASLEQERQEFARARELFEPARARHVQALQELGARTQALNGMEAELRRRQEAFERTKEEWINTQRSASNNMQRDYALIKQKHLEADEVSRRAEQKRQEYEERVSNLKKILT